MQVLAIFMSIAYSNTDVYSELQMLVNFILLQMHVTAILLLSTASITAIFMSTVTFRQQQS